MNTLPVHNPATGAPIAELPADDAASVAAKARRARAAQPAWAAVPLTERKACITRFRAGIVAELDALAAVMTRETGKPLARGNTVQWFPWPGRHLIELVDAGGKVVDQRRLEVRGAGVVAKNNGSGARR